jgi:molybdopterin converting factor small subunit
LCCTHFLPYRPQDKDNKAALMVVTVKAHGALRERIPSNRVIEDVQTVGEAIERLSIPSDIGLSILVNGHLAHWRTPLHDGDIIQLVPQISGGRSAGLSEEG